MIGICWAGLQEGTLKDRGTAKKLPFLLLSFLSNWNVDLMAGDVNWELITFRYYSLPPLSVEPWDIPTYSWFPNEQLLHHLGTC